MSRYVPVYINMCLVNTGIGIYQFILVLSTVDTRGSSEDLRLFDDERWNRSVHTDTLHEDKIMVLV